MDDGKEEITMNVFDYLDWRGDMSFFFSPFNEVDNLIFAELAYLNLENIVPEDDSYRVSLEFVLDKYRHFGYDQSYLINDPGLMLERAVLTDRYKGIMLSNYVEIIDEEKHIQFSAVTFHLPDHTVYVGFSGTDNSIVGWREDFNISLLEETPGQYEAVKYLNGIIDSFDGRIIVGGHSKGGNFAVYASAFCKRPDRVFRVYSNDGPGFNEKTVRQPEYFAVLEKTVKFIPESSVVGILLESRADCTVIASDGKRFMQHDPYTWNVMGPRFERADQRSFSSIFMDETLGRWLSSLDRDQKRTFIEMVFDSLEASGMKSFSEFKNGMWVVYNVIVGAVSSMDKQTARLILDSLKMLAKTSREVFWNETKKSFERRRNDGEDLIEGI